MLFLHGYLSSKEAFLYQIQYFSAFYRVTAIDFLGFGNSEKLNEPFSVSDYADWLKSAMQKLGIEKPCVIAHSFGCRVAVKTASKDSDVFDKIVLTGPAGIIINRGLSYKIKVKAYRFVKKFFPRYADKRFGSREYRSLSPIMRESYKKIVNEDLREDAKKVENSVLIIQGKDDKTTTEREAQIYLESFPNAKLIKTNGGHFSFVEYPTNFNLIVEEFLYE